MTQGIVLHKNIIANWIFDTVTLHVYLNIIQYIILIPFTVQSTTNNLELCLADGLNLGCLYSLYVTTTAVKTTKCWDDDDERSRTKYYKSHCKCKLSGQNGKDNHHLYASRMMLALFD